MGRAPCCEKVGLKRGRWTEEEDQLLTNYILANGEGSWRSLPKNAGLLRCGKSCRLRWINYLKADIKRGNITSEEDKIILDLHSSFGNRWSLIAAHLPGRTDNEIKNYWNTHLSRKLHNFSDRSKSDEISISSSIINLPKPKGRTKSSTTVKKSVKSSTIVLDHQPAIKEKENATQVSNVNAGVMEVCKVSESEASSTCSINCDDVDKASGGEEETKGEILGPDEWLDIEIKKLCSTLVQRDHQDQILADQEKISAAEINNECECDMIESSNYVEKTTLGFDHEEYWNDLAAWGAEIDDKNSILQLWDDNDGDNWLCW